MRDRKQVYHITIMLTIILTITMLFTGGCKDDPVVPPSLQEKITITVDDVSCTEAWLNIKTENIQLPAEGTLTTEGINKTISLNTADTIIYVDSLQPNKSYSFSFTINNATAKAETKTMDTTSHSFSWQSFEFGETMSNTIYDVAIIDENNIWAVGEIYLRDSTGQIDPQPYNAVYWDGQKWKLLKIPFVYQGSNFYGSIYSVYAFSKNDIWFGMGSLIHYDGANFYSVKIPDEVFPSRANKICGTTDNDLYVVGNEGNIAHYNGTSWTKIESGTTEDILDIRGAFNNRTLKYDVIAAVMANSGNTLLQIDGSRASVLNNDGISYGLHGIWFIPDRRYYAVGNGIYQKRTLDSGQWHNEGVTSSQSTGVGGSALNNVFACGSFGELVHFNGIGWYNYRNELKYRDGLFGCLDVKDNLVVIGGYSQGGSKALVILGKRS